MANIKRSIELEIIPKGTERIIELLKAMDPKQLNEDQQKHLQSLIKGFQELGKQAQAALKTPMGAEATEEIRTTFNTMIGELAQIFSSSLKGTAKDFEETISTSLAVFYDAYQDWEKARRARVGVERSFKLSPDDPKTIEDPTTRTGQIEILERGLEIYKESAIRAKEMTQDEANRLSSARSLLELKDKTLEASSHLTKEEREQVAPLLEQFKWSELKAEQQEKLMAFMNTRLKKETIAFRFQTASLAKEQEFTAKREKALEVAAAIALEEKAKATMMEEQLRIANSLDDIEVSTSTEDSEEDLKTNTELVTVLRSLVGVINEQREALEDISTTKEDVKNKTKNLTKEKKKSTSTFAKATQQVFNYGLAFTFLRRIYRETLRTIKDLDAAFTEMAIVTIRNREEAWRLADTMSDLARETGFTTTEIAKLSTVYFRQGRALSEVIELTRVAAMAAKIAGISAVESANFLTSAVNGFGLAANEVLSVSDKFAALASQSASSYEELAVGLSKFAAQANVAGVSMDFAMGMLAKGVETTREAPETIGTALKTVLARMRELTDFGATLEDGMDVSRVERALGQIGVQLRNSNGLFRDMEQVITDVGQRWGELNVNQQASIAVALAGTRQQSRLIAIMNDFDRTLELVNISQESAGATTAQHVEYMKSMEAALIGLQTAYQEFIRSIAESEVLIAIVKGMTGFLNGLTAAIESLGVTTRAITILIVALVVAMIGYKKVLKPIILFLSMQNKLLAQQLGLEKANQKSKKISLFFNNLWAKSMGYADIKLMKQNLGISTNTTLTNINTKARTTLLAVSYAQFKTNLLLSASYGSYTVALIKATIATIQFIIALIPLIWPFLLIGAAIAAVTAALFFWNRETKDSKKAIAEQTKELQAQRYELRRATKSTQEFIDKIKELNSLSFRTKEQEEELEDLAERLAEIHGADVVIRVGETVLWDETFDAIEEKQREEIKNLNRDLFSLFDDIAEEYSGKDFLELSRQDRSTVIDSWSLSYEEFLKRVDIENKEFFYNALGDFFDISNQWADFSDLDSELDFQKFSLFIKEIESGILSLDDFYDQFESFKSIIEDSELDPRFKEVLIKRFPNFDFLLENFTDDFIKTLEFLKITTIDELQEITNIVDDSEILEDLLNQVDLFSKKLKDSLEIEEETALSLAWQHVANSTNDAELALFAYSKAFSGTNQEFAQELQATQSRIDNIMESREKFLSGEMSYVEMEAYISDLTTDLITTQEDLERFLSGEGFSAKIIVDQMKQREMATSRLASAYTILNDKTDRYTQLQKQGAIADIAFYSSLLKYRGALSETSKELYEYNKLIEQTNMLKSLGIDISERQVDLAQSEAQALITLSNSLLESIDSSILAFNNKMKDMEQENTFEDFFIFDGSSIKVDWDSLRGINGLILEEVTKFEEEFNEILTNSFETFISIRDSQLNREKDRLDEQRKIYENHFKAIDRIESKAERERDREELVEQLQRLELATDERSRQKALEIRRELNEMDRRTAQEERVESRQSLLDSFDEVYEEMEARWGELFSSIVQNLELSGESMGTNFIDSIRDSEVFDSFNVDFEQIINTAGTKIQTAGDQILKAFSLLEGEDSWVNAFENSVEILNDESGPIAKLAIALEKLGSVNLDEAGPGEHSNFPTIEELEDSNEESRRLLAKAEFDEWWESIGSIEQVGSILRWMFQNRKRKELEEKYNVDSFSEGGMVDYTGLAMMHGSGSSPEAVLNPKQTEMFIQLRNTLAGLELSDNRGSSSPITIQNIEIKTNELNKNLDFEKAGETLATSFSKAINRRGLNLNVKR